MTDFPLTRDLLTGLRLPGNDLTFFKRNCAALASELDALISLSAARGGVEAFDSFVEQINREDQHGALRLDVRDLLARIDELPWTDLAELEREWAGHVEPVLERLRGAAGDHASARLLLDAVAVAKGRKAEVRKLDDLDTIALILRDTLTVGEGSTDGTAVRFVDNIDEAAGYVFEALAEPRS